MAGWIKHVSTLLLLLSELFLLFKIAFRSPEMKFWNLRITVTVSPAHLPGLNLLTPANL